MLITKSELAARKGVTLATVAHWGRRGLLRMKGNKVDFEATEKILAQRSPTRRRDRPKADESPEEFVTRTVIDGGHAPWSVEEAQRIKENALAVLRQVEADLARGEVLPKKDVAAAWLAKCAVVRAALLSLPARIAPALVNTSDPNLIRAKLDAAYREAWDETFGGQSMNGDYPNSARQARRLVERAGPVVVDTADH